MTTHQDTVYAPALVTGDGTNQVSISDSGHLTLEGTATVWDDLRIAATATSKGAARAPGFAQLLDDGDSSTGVYAYQFDKATEEELHFAVQFPHTWKTGSTVYPHVHWCPVDTDTGNVIWGLEYTWASITGTLGNTTIITVTDAADGTAFKHQLADFDGIAGTGKTASSMMLCRVFRQAADESDTYDNDAALLEIDFHYEIDKLGDDTTP